jgi:hypothetical protein
MCKLQRQRAAGLQATPRLAARGLRSPVAGLQRGGRGRGRERERLLSGRLCVSMRLSNPSSPANSICTPRRSQLHAVHCALLSPSRGPQCYVYASIFPAERAVCS